MKKKYKSTSTISLNVVLESKKNKHITFIPQSDGGSIFITDNKNIQDALERHYKFGHLFKLVSVEDETTQKKDTRSVEQPIEQPIKRRVKVTDISAAKDFLADTFNISRTTLRSERAIIEAAEQHNIVFEGLD